MTTSGEKSVGTLLEAAHARECRAGGALTWAVVLRRARAEVLRGVAGALRTAADEVDEAAAMLESKVRRPQ